ncbi:hypothetical protein NM688_g915 [Phlebia brevispora]|uniref:Uncharacterized protein n=1 Tax=Phlebia brevispora TaxID=194682 RepID=A0ACC1TD02_9APHY|nr:hypothetical protein NM688_g915 [Phlebia brevispora]
MNNVNQRMIELNIQDVSPEQPTASNATSDGTPAAADIDRLVSVPRPRSRTKWQIFGWRLDDDWMIDYGRQLCDASVTNEYDLFQAAVKDIQGQSGLSRYAIENGMRMGCNPFDTKERIHLILSILKPTVNEFRTRPTQSQADKVSAILGCRPKWWLDATPVIG